MPSKRTASWMIGLSALAVFATSSAVYADLSEFQWKNRLLLVFDDSKDAALLRTQRKIYDENQADMKERDLLFFEVAKDRARVIGKPAPEMDAAKLRSLLSVESQEKQVVLIGKDGGVKHRREGVIEAPDLFAIIDAMPMRQSEMRSNDEIK
ncbi:DUF4174 domain-containing protein [Pseudovibrio sp. SPO723]|uniref:DUF4174 domain-containing protein n=1 Tax=Nesiotobacter zosterae TaxID=392721 RepID=UPI0029C1649B|nr:DUF4174 domain-containing protein [Pseudovibrio sp. SPO723]MDX5593839.1 DUF4174 domain-containing protein [Pseudovibrio sp. SPO723]